LYELSREYFENDFRILNGNTIEASRRASRSISQAWIRTPPRRWQSAIHQHFSAVDIRENETARVSMGFRTPQRSEAKLMSFSVFAYQWRTDSILCHSLYQ